MEIEKILPIVTTGKPYRPGCRFATVILPECFKKEYSIPKTEKGPAFVAYLILKPHEKLLSLV